MFKCSVCSKKFSNVVVLIRHLKIVHKLNSSNNYKCGQDNCSRTFQTIAKFKSHLIRKHANDSHKCLPNEQPLNVFTHLEPS